MQYEETTLTLAPEERQRILAEAFAGADETVRLPAPRIPTGIPSPLGDDDELPESERPTLPGTPISLRLSHGEAVTAVDATPLVYAFSCLLAIAATVLAVLHHPRRGDRALPSFFLCYTRRMAKITGIGGVFFKARGDKQALAAWYRDNLGLALEPWGGAILKWPDDHGKDGGQTVWTLAASDSTWFAPSASPFMINYRVDDLAGLLAELRAKGVAIEKGPEEEENGTFAWLMDPDGNRVELWEPR